MIAEALIAGFLRLGPGDERDRVVVRAGRRRQPVGHFVQSDVHHARGAVKSLVLEYCGSFTARFMNSAQMGAAVVPPISFMSV